MNLYSVFSKMKPLPEYNRGVEAEETEKKDDSISLLEELDLQMVMLKTLLDSTTDPDAKSSISLALQGIERVKQMTGLMVSQHRKYQKFAHGLEKKIFGSTNGSGASLRELNRAIDHMVGFAHEDELTKLANRRYFLKQLNHRLLEMRHRHAQGILPNPGFSLVYLDFDGMKDMNDTLGHNVGDIALRDFAAMIKLYFRVQEVSLRNYFKTQSERRKNKTDLPCRLGGDEFLIMVESMQYRLLEARITELERLFVMSMQSYFETKEIQAVLQGRPSPIVGVSYGIIAVEAASAPNTAQELIQQAEQEMYTLKNLRKSNQAS